MTKKKKWTLAAADPRKKRHVLSFAVVHTTASLNSRSLHLHETFFYRIDETNENEMESKMYASQIGARIRWCCHIFCLPIFIMKHNLAQNGLVCAAIFFFKRFFFFFDDIHSMQCHWIYLFVKVFYVFTRTADIFFFCVSNTLPSLPLFHFVVQSCINQFILNSKPFSLEKKNWNSKKCVAKKHSDAEKKRKWFRYFFIEIETESMNHWIDWNGKENCWHLDDVIHCSVLLTCILTQT